MADGYIGIDEPTTIDKRADTEELTVNSTLVHRERIQVTGTTAAAIADPVNAVPSSSAYGLPTREVRSNQTSSGALGALNAAVTIDAQDAGQVVFEIDTGTLVGTVSFEATLDDSTWFSVLVLPENNGGITSGLTAFGTRGHFANSGYSQVRMKVTAYTSGTSNARLEASRTAGVVQIGNIAPSASVDIGETTEAEATGDGSIIAILKRLRTLLGSLGLDATLTAIRDRLPAALVGGRLDVVVGAALPAGTNNIGDVDVLTLPALAAGTNNIGDVDVATVPAPLSTTGGGTEATALRVTLANDSTGVVSIDDNGGSLTVDGAVAVTNAGTFVTQENGAALTALQLLDNIVHTEDEASADGQSGVPSMAVRKATPANTSGADGDYEMLQMSAGRLWTSATIDAALPAGDNNVGNVDIATVPAPLSTTGGGTEAAALRVTLANDSTGVVSVDDNGGTLTVDGTVTADTELPAAAALADNAANPTAPAVGAFNMVYDGTNWDRLPGTSADGALVNLGANNDVTVTGTVTANLAAGTNNIGDVDILTIAAGDNNIGNVDIVTGPTGANALAVQGTVAHDGAAAQNPVSVGGTAETPDDSAPANQTSADGDVTRIVTDRDGAVYTHPHPPRIWHVASEYTTQQTDATVKAAPGAGLSLYITDIYIACNAAVTVTLEESTTTLKFRYYAAGQGDGVSKNFTVPIKIAANTLISVTTSAAVTCTVVVCGYTAP